VGDIVRVLGSVEGESPKGRVVGENVIGIIAAVTPRHFIVRHGECTFRARKRKVRRARALTAQRTVITRA